MATTSEKLLDAALDVILEKGWAQASTRAVADRAGVRPGVVHYHFASQPDLRIDAAMRGLEPLRVALTEAIARRDLQSAISMATGPNWARLLSEMTMSAMHDESAARATRGFMAALRDSVADVLRREGTPAGTAAAKAAALTAGMDGIGLHASLDPDFPVAEATTALLEFLGGTP